MGKIHAIQYTQRREPMDVVDRAIRHHFESWCADTLLGEILDGPVTIRAEYDNMPLPPWITEGAAMEHTLQIEWEPVQTMQVRMMEPVYPAEKLAMTWKQEWHRQRLKLRKPRLLIRRMFRRAELAMFGREF